MTAVEKQKQVLLTRKGGPEVLEIVEREVPEPGPGEARVRVLAAGVAFADVMMRRGLYPGVPDFPFTPGYDLVGEVEDLGPGVSGVAVGQRVAALAQVGAHAQYVALPAGELVPVPAGVDAAEAASLPVNYVTAYQMLFRVAKVKPGERILVHGAAGGVGTALLQLGGLQGLGGEARPSLRARGHPDRLQGRGLRGAGSRLDRRRRGRGVRPHRGRARRPLIPDAAPGRPAGLVRALRGPRGR